MRVYFLLICDIFHIDSMYKYYFSSMLSMGENIMFLRK